MRLLIRWGGAEVPDWGVLLGGGAGARDGGGGSGDDAGGGRRGAGGGGARGPRGGTGDGQRGGTGGAGHAGARQVGALVSEYLPRRLAALLLELAGVPFERRLAELSREQRRATLDALEAFPLPVAGNEGFRTAEVTGGGIPLAELSPRTLESRVAAGLHFAGEMIDGTGRVGGFNFLWAWVTGRRAGEAAAAAAASGD
jgi:hypothetical protein